MKTILHFWVIFFLLFICRFSFGQKQFVFGDSLANEKGIVSHQLPDGSIWVIGSGARANELNMDVIAVKIDTGGTVLSNFNRYGTVDLEYPNNMIYQGGKFIIVGEQHSSTGVDGFVLVIDTQGVQESFQTYGLPNQSEQFFDIKPTMDGGFVVSGFSSVGPGNDFLIGKFDSTYQLEWLRSHDLGTNDIGVTVIENPSGGFLIAGDQPQPLGNYNVVVMAVDNLGNALWDKFISNPFNGGCKTMIKMGDDLLIVGEMSTNTSSSFDIYLVKIDWQGNIKWQKTVPKTNSGDACFDAYLNNPNEVILTGYAYSTATNSTDMFVMAVDSSGNVLSEEYFHYGQFEMGYDVKPNRYGGFIMTGFAKNVNTGADEFFVTLSNIGTMTAVETTNRRLLKSKIYPNPTKDQVFIPKSLVKFELKVYDINGKEKKVVVNNNQVSLNSFSSGIYLFLFSDGSGNTRYTQKLVVE